MSLEHDLGTYIATSIILRKFQTARHAKNEGPMDFADRCKGLAQRVTSKANDPVA